MDSATGIATTWNPSGPAVRIAFGDSTAFLVNVIGGIREVSLESGVATSWDPAPEEPVRCVAVWGTKVYVGGAFSLIASSVTKSPYTDNVASFQGAADQPLSYQVTAKQRDSESERLEHFRSLKRQNS